MAARMTNKTLIISPETKIADLLKVYPELENVLIEMAPAFDKLRNPILRKTIAKLANLRQAAELGNVRLGLMINRLRSEVNQEELIENSDDKDLNLKREPDWVSIYSTRETLDARPMLDAGEHPVNIVMQEILKLKDRQKFELITSFVPTPLIEMAQNKGFQAWTTEESGDKFVTCFKKR